MLRVPLGLVELLHWLPNPRQVMGYCWLLLPLLSGPLLLLLTLLLSVQGQAQLAAVDAEAAAKVRATLAA
jgi:hypothetical protein